MSLVRDLLDGIDCHPACGAIPVMGDEDFLALVADIADRGLREQIALAADGTLLDGRHRLAALRHLGQDWEPYTFTVPADTDYDAWVYSYNVARRHMSFQERLAAATRLRATLVSQRTAPSGGYSVRPEAHEVADGGERASDRAGAAFGVSANSIDRYRAIQDFGSAHLKAAFESSELPLAVAATIARDYCGDPASQADAIADYQRQQEEKAEKRREVRQVPGVFGRLRALFDEMNADQRVQAMGIWDGWIEDTAATAAN